MPPLMMMAFMSMAMLQDTATLARRAEAEQPLVELFSYQDYPPDAQLRGSSGTTRVRLLVGTDGRAHECEVVVSAGDPSLDRAACDILIDRSRFRPARDHSGRITEDRITTQIRWEIGRTQMFEPSRLIVELRAENGTSRCSVNWDGRESTAPISYCVEELGGFAVLLTQPDVRALRVESIFVPTNQGSRAITVESAGEQLLRYEGELAIAPNGTVSRCDVTRRDSSALLTELLGDFAPCSAFRSERYEELREGRELRRARFETSYFIVRRPRR